MQKTFHVTVEVDDDGYTVDGDRIHRLLTTRTVLPAGTSILVKEA